MATTEELEKRVDALEARNKRVEFDHDWNTSFTRKLILFIFTYLAIALYFLAITIPKPFLNAFVPAVGFWFSTLTLPVFRKIWEKRLKK